MIGLKLAGTAFVMFLVVFLVIKLFDNDRGTQLSRNSKIAWGFFLWVAIVMLFIGLILAVWGI